MKDIAIFGAGGLGREIPCIIEKINQVNPQWNFLGFFDDNFIKGSKIDNYEVLGGMEELNAWNNPISICVCIGTPTIVKQIVTNITNENVDFPNIISPDVYFYDCSTVRLGKGNIFNHNVIVSINVSIGDFNTFGANTVLGHDANVGDFNTMMVSSQICGHSSLEALNFMGIASIILQGVHIENNVTIGAGSIVMKDTVNDATYFGNPARPMIKK